MTKSQGVTFPHAYLKITEKKKEIYKYKLETEYPRQIQNLQQEVVNMQKALLIDENRSMYEDLWDRMTSNERIAFAEPDIDDSKGRSPITFRGVAHSEWSHLDDFSRAMYLLICSSMDICYAETENNITVTNNIGGISHYPKFRTQ